MPPRMVLRLHLLLIVFLACASTLAAQPVRMGTEAQAASEQPQQAQPRKRALHLPQTAARTVLPVRAAAPAQPLGSQVLQKALAQRPARPHRPIPVVLVLLGLLLILLFTGALILTILAPAGLFALFLILTIVFAPLLLLGIVFVIGGFIAAFSGGHGPQPQSGSPK